MVEDSERDHPIDHSRREVMRDFKTYVFQISPTGQPHGGLMVASTKAELLTGPRPWLKCGFGDEFDPGAGVQPCADITIDVSGAPELSVGGEYVLQLDGDSLADGWLTAVRGGGGCLVAVSAGEQILYAWATVLT